MTVTLTLTATHPQKKNLLASSALFLPLPPSIYLFLNLTLSRFPVFSSFFKSPSPLSSDVCGKERKEMACKLLLVVCQSKSFLFLVFFSVFFLGFMSKCNRKSNRKKENPNRQPQPYYFSFLFASSKGQTNI